MWTSCTSWGVFIYKLDQHKLLWGDNWSVRPSKASDWLTDWIQTGYFGYFVLFFSSLLTGSVERVRYFWGDTQERITKGWDWQNIHTHTFSSSSWRDIMDTKMQLLHIVYKVFIPYGRLKYTVSGLVYFLQWIRLVLLRIINSQRKTSQPPESKVKRCLCENYAFSHFF